MQKTFLNTRSYVLAGLLRASSSRLVQLLILDGDILSYTDSLEKVIPVSLKMAQSKRNWS